MSFKCCREVFHKWLVCMELLFLILAHCSTMGRGGIVIYTGNEDIEEFADSELPNTKPVSKHGLEGAIVSANPPDACFEIDPPPQTDAHLNWFVLIAGNKCDYNVKVNHSQRAGYTAAIIYNFIGKHEAIPHRRWHGQFFNITAVTVRTSSGFIILDNYLYSKDPRFRAFIFPNDSFNIMAFLLLFVVLAGVFVIVVLFCLIVRFVQSARSYQHSRTMTQRLRQLRTQRYQKGDPYDTCAICLEDYDVADKLRILPCFHGYHAKCVDPWLTAGRPICPVCKYQVSSERTFSSAYESDSDLERSEATPLLGGFHSVTSSNYQSVREQPPSSSLTEAGTSQTARSDNDTMSETGADAAVRSDNGAMFDFPARSDAVISGANRFIQKCLAAMPNANRSYNGTMSDAAARFNDGSVFETAARSDAARSDSERSDIASRHDTVARSNADSSDIGFRSNTAAGSNADKSDIASKSDTAARSNTDI